jgi:CyaY protein
MQKITMTEQEFNRAVRDTLQQVEQAVETCGANIDFENSGDILTLEFGDGSRIILNRQGAARQLWVAARAGGFHYGWRDGRWLNDQSGAELFDELSRLVSEQSGDTIRLA